MTVLLVPAHTDTVETDVLVLYREPTDETQAIAEELSRRGRSHLAFRPSDLSIHCDGTISVHRADGAELRPKVVLGWYSLQERIFGFHVLQAFEAMGLPVVNSSRTLEICQSKILISIALTEASLPHAPTQILGADVPTAPALDQLGLPVVLKPENGTKGMGVRLLSDEEAVAMQRVGLSEAREPILLQRRIERPDCDIRVQCAAFEPLFSYYRHAQSGRFLTNLHEGGQLDYPGPSNDELIDLASRAALAVRAPMAGVDFVEGPDGYRILEVNSVAGFITFARFSTREDGSREVGLQATRLLVDMLEAEAAP